MLYTEVLCINGLNQFKGLVVTHDGQPVREGSRPEKKLPAGTVDLLNFPLVLCCPYRLVSMSLNHVFSLLSSLNPQSI